MGPQKRELKKNGEDSEDDDENNLNHPGTSIPNFNFTMPDTNGGEREHRYQHGRNNGREIDEASGYNSNLREALQLKEIEKDADVSNLPPGFALTKSGKVVKKNGRVNGRQLVSWDSDRMFEKLFLNIIYECHRRGIILPWGPAVHRLKPGSSGNSAIQKMTKLRDELALEGHLVPPLNGKVTVLQDPKIRGFLRDPLEENEDNAWSTVKWGDAHEHGPTIPIPGHAKGSGTYRKLGGGKGLDKLVKSATGKRRSRLPAEIAATKSSERTRPKVLMEAFSDDDVEIPSKRQRVDAGGRSVKRESATEDASLITPARTPRVRMTAAQFAKATKVSAKTSHARSGRKVSASSQALTLSDNPSEGEYDDELSDDEDGASGYQESARDISTRNTRRGAVDHQSRYEDGDDIDRDFSITGAGGMIGSNDPFTNELGRSDSAHQQGTPRSVADGFGRQCQQSTRRTPNFTRTHTPTSPSVRQGRRFTGNDALAYVAQDAMEIGQVNRSSNTSNGQHGRENPTTGANLTGFDAHGLSSNNGGNGYGMSGHGGFSSGGNAAGPMAGNTPHQNHDQGITNHLLGSNYGQTNNEIDPYGAHGAFMLGVNNHNIQHTFPASAAGFGSAIQNNNQMPAYSQAHNGYQPAQFQNGNVDVANSCSVGFGNNPQYSLGYGTNNPHQRLPTNGPGPDHLRFVGLGDPGHHYGIYGHLDDSWVSQGFYGQSHRDSVTGLSMQRNAQPSFQADLQDRGFDPSNIYAPQRTGSAPQAMPVPDAHQNHPSETENMVWHGMFGHPASPPPANYGVPNTPPQNDDGDWMDEAFDFGQFEEDQKDEK